MSLVDWAVLVGSLGFIVIYGMVRGRGSRNLTGYLLADRGMKWVAIALSIMATQASAITFLSAPGLGYADGVRFVQFYLGLPVAMIVLSAIAVPLYHRFRIYTAYEFLEDRLDLKTRTIAAVLFLIQRGLAAGLTIYAPSIILSVLLGWNIYLTNLIIGLLVISYTAAGGTKAVSHTHFLQMMVIIGGIGLAFALALRSLPDGVGVGDAVAIAGEMGRLNAIDFSFDWNSRYTFWSGLIGGFFLQLSYFGTDQSQVGRYLTGKNVTESRLALLFNGIIKIPMQFVILSLGALLLVFYQFTAPPIFFNPNEVDRVRASGHAGEFEQVEREYGRAFVEKQQAVRELVDAKRSGTEEDLLVARRGVREARDESDALRDRAIGLIQRADPDAQASDTNYVFLTFVLNFLPVGVIGLVLAAIIAASMSSTAAELNALASTTVVDIYQRFVSKDTDPLRQVRISKIATVIWGLFAIAFAEYASRLGSLIEAVNILGSLAYGTILGIFLMAFLAPGVGGRAVFLGAILAEIVVIVAFRATEISFLWYNVIGCLGVVFFAFLIALFFPKNPRKQATATG